MTGHERGQMRAVLGEIKCPVSGSRPDLPASCSLLQQRRVAKAAARDLMEIDKVVSQAHDHAHVEFRICLLPVDDVEIGVWSAASFANAKFF